MVLILNAKNVCQNVRLVKLLQNVNLWNIVKYNVQYVKNHLIIVCYVKEKIENLFLPVYVNKNTIKMKILQIVYLVPHNVQNVQIMIIVLNVLVIYLLDKNVINKLCRIPFNFLLKTNLDPMKQFILNVKYNVLLVNMNKIIVQNVQQVLKDLC